MSDLHIEYYDMLHAETPEVVLLLARCVARDDVSVEKALHRWAGRACAKHWDRLLLELSDVLPEYRTEEAFDEADRVEEGDCFRVRLPDGEALRVR